MRPALLLLALTLISSQANADGDSHATPPAACNVAALLSSVGNMRELPEMPIVRKGRAEAVRFVSLFESPGGTDLFSYEALIDTMNRQAWVYQHGGYAGVSHWYGPIEIDMALIEGCPPVKTMIPISAASQPKGAGQ